MQSRPTIHQGTSAYSLKFEVDKSIVFYGVELLISSGPIELILTVCECKDSYQRPLQRLYKMFRAETGNGMNYIVERSAHVSFESPILLGKNKIYTIHALLKGCQLTISGKLYRNQLIFNKNCLIIHQSQAENDLCNDGAVFTALMFRNIEDYVRRKIPITI